MSNFRHGEFNVEAKIDDCGRPGEISSVTLELGSRHQVEREIPYTLYGYRGQPDLGEHTLRACLSTRSNRDFGCYEVDVEITPCDQSIKEFILYDAVNAKPLESIDDGSELCLPSPDKINIEAVVNTCVDDVYLELVGGNKTETRTEYQDPYFLFGDEDSMLNFRSGFSLESTYILRATPDEDPTLKSEVTFTFHECR